MFNKSCAMNRPGIRQWLSFRDPDRPAANAKPAGQKNSFYMAAMLASSGSYSETDFGSGFSVDVDGVN